MTSFRTALRDLAKLAMEDRKAFLRINTKSFNANKAAVYAFLKARLSNDSNDE
jgi:hypothetical protein